jgi:hypothetical protein
MEHYAETGNPPAEVLLWEECIKNIFCGTYIYSENSKEDKHLEECPLLGCGAVYILCEPTFRRKVSPPSSW